MPKDWLPNVTANGIINPSVGGLAFIENNFVPFIISTLIFLVIILSLIFAIVAGVMWITSNGSKEGLAKAKAALTYAIVGLVLGLCSFLIIRFLGFFLGVNLGF